MINETGEITGAGGTKLFAQWWLPEAAPKAVVAIVHGFGEHSGRYLNLVNHLLMQGYAIYGFDHRGHGRSPGQRGYISCWDEYRGDVQAFLDFVHARQPSLPVFLYGHSMGGMISLDYILRPPQGIEKAGLSGAILSGVPLVPTGAGGPLLIAAAKVLSRVLPRLPMNLGLDPAGISRDKVVVQAYQADPLVHGKTCPRWGTEIMNTTAWVKAHPDALKIPVLFVHGANDPYGSAEGARAYYDTLTQPDKAFYVYPGSLHEVHNDLDYKQLCLDIELWLEKHLAPQPQPAAEA